MCGGAFNFARKKTIGGTAEPAAKLLTEQHCGLMPQAFSPR